MPWFPAPPPLPCRQSLALFLIPHSHHSGASLCYSCLHALDSPLSSSSPQTVDPAELSTAAEDMGEEGEGQWEGESEEDLHLSPEEAEVAVSSCCPPALPLDDIVPGIYGVWISWCLDYIVSRRLDRRREPRLLWVQPCLPGLPCQPFMADQQNVHKLMKRFFGSVGTSPQGKETQVVLGARPPTPFGLPTTAVLCCARGCRKG